MKKTLDTYFTLARHSEVAVGLSAIETLIGTIKPVPVPSGIKSLFTKNRYIMNAVTGVIITGSLALLSWFIVPDPGPQKQPLVLTETDSSVNYQEAQSVPPDTLPKQAKSQGGKVAGSVQQIPVPDQPTSAGTYPKPGSADTITALAPDSPDQIPGSQAVAIQSSSGSKPATKPVSCCKPKKTKPLANQIEEVSDFSYNGGLWAMVECECLYGMMNREAEIVVPVDYEKIDKKFRYNDKNWCKVIKNGRCGFIDTNGKEVVPCIYEDLTDFKFNDGQWAKAFREGYTYFLNREGKEVKITLREDQ